MEYRANVDVRLFKSPEYLYRDTVRAGTIVTISTISGDWGQLTAPLRYATYWGEMKYFTLVEPPPPPPPEGKRIIGAIVYYDDGSTEELVPKV